ncbi:uncharacterized protein AMSG_03342 [Thecamonas trahens ATCC 50062]|uniref:Ketoreductase domain-containing protein n=1 Tax=Thecamonas trahens ATCC 50062 TaxID=461836 RepID=A0A0L0D479_THETB|nr:hypothetical protein AMSG_03342 [Thecamonas trahens ATCC 50062]KNC46911.1 hypothetical protein AMSG_03342 [Thecamonas trahens ATCC 50062]|eukprot:XP_013760184.1 hypothetical protein AMSG_03342 [Thecamonas trahens ATCC 50062]
MSIPQVVVRAGKAALTAAGLSLAGLAVAWRGAKTLREARYYRRTTVPRKAPVVVITGGSSGLGAGLALRYAARGARLVLAARGEARLAGVAAACAAVAPPGTPLPVVVPTDVAVEDEAVALVASALDAFGRIDIVVLSAGVGAHALFQATDDMSVLETLMRINFFGAVYVTKAALPHLIAGKGQIVVMSSLSGEIGLPYRAGYCASKFAVTGFFEALRMEVNESDVQITIVCPPSVKTAFRDNLVLNMTSQDVAGESSGTEGDDRMPVDECLDHVMDAIDHGRRKVYFPFLAYLAVYIRPFFPELVDWNAKRKAKL